MNRKLLISKTIILQYFAIYMLIMMNSSRIWVVIQHRNEILTYAIKICIIAIWLWFILKSGGKLRNGRDVGFILFLSAATIIVRLLNGGAGLDVLSEWITYIAIVDISIEISKEHFLDRFINVVYFLSIISIVCFIIQLSMPGVLKSIFAQYDSNFTEYIGWGPSGAIYGSPKAWGKFLFTLDERNVTRNLGVFSEPGCYQIVLNSSIFVLLFLNKYVSFSLKENNRRLVIISLALLTCQSTTGYLGFCLLILFYLIENGTLDNTKRKVLGIALGVVVVLLIDYAANGEGSIINTVVIKKLFGNGNSIDLSQSTGIYRVQTITSAMRTMFANPFGVGYTRANEIISNSFSGSAGASLILTGAALGVIPFIVFIYWTLSPVLRCPVLDRTIKVLYVLLWLNTILAQSEELYTGLIFIPMYCATVLDRIRAEKFGGYIDEEKDYTTN